MKRHFRQRLFVIGSVISLTGCLEPYQPSAVKDEPEIVVIDGFIDATNHSATVSLSYASSLASTTPPVTVPDASVAIEESGGSSYTLNENGPGVYTREEFIVDVEKKYRLHVTMANDKEYTSDFIDITQNPDIESVTWRMNNSGVLISVNTHDPKQLSKYYRWNYVETWEYISSFFSTYKMVDGTAIERPVDERIYVCWDSHPSTEILLGSSVRLSDDVIQDYPIVFLPGNSVKISRRYSILVQQRTLTKEAYDFWLQLEKTTESLGGLFDPLPSQVLGNIKSTNDPGEPVLGYFSGGQVSEKRIFIAFLDLPDELLAMKERALCPESDVTSISVSDIPGTPNSTYLIDPIYVQGVGIVGYTTAPAPCVDCRVLGGSTKKPDFW